MGRVPGRRNAGDMPPVRMQVPRLALRPRRRAHVRSAGARVLRRREESIRSRARPLRGVERVHLHQSRSRAAAGPAGVPRADDHGARRVPVRRAHRTLRLRRAQRQQLEAVRGRVPGVLPCPDAAPPAGAARGPARRRGHRMRTLPGGRAPSRGEHRRDAALGPAAGGDVPDRARDPQWSRRAMGDARHRITAGRGQPRGCGAVGYQQLPDLPERRDTDLRRLVPRLSLLADVTGHAPLRRYARVPPGAHRAGAHRARGGGGRVQGIRVAGRRHARRDAGGARGGRARRVPAERPGGPRPALPPRGRRLGHRSSPRAGGSGRMSAMLPERFAAIEPFAPTWCLATEAERWRRRHASTMAELTAFYDAFFPRLEEAIDYCNAFPLDGLPDDATNLLKMIYSLVMVSMAIEVFGQPKTVDAAGAVLDRVKEPKP